MQDGQTLSEIHVWYLAKLRFVPNLGSGSLVVGESSRRFTVALLSRMMAVLGHSDVSFYFNSF